MTELEAIQAHYTGLALARIANGGRDPGMMTERADLMRAGLPIDAEGKAIVEKIDD